MFYTATIMGFAGSLHCAGMCSPLAMAMTRNKPFLLSSILYNSGRIFLYGLLGALAAAFGSMLHLNSYQQIISIVLGGLFLLAGFSFRSVRIPFLDKAIAAFTSYLKKGFGIISNQKLGYTTFILGMLNGMLPCGLTYLALSACLAHLSKIAMIFVGCTLLLRVWWTHPHNMLVKAPQEVNVCK